MRNCKYCGNEPYLEKLIISNCRTKHYVRCRICGQQFGMYGKELLSSEQAVNGWNERQEERWTL